MFGAQAKQFFATEFSQVDTRIGLALTRLGDQEAFTDQVSCSYREVIGQPASAVNDQLAGMCAQTTAFGSAQGQSATGVALGEDSQASVGRPDLLLRSTQAAARFGHQTIPPSAWAVSMQ